MKTPKRIGLLLKLKWKESKVILIFWCFWAPYSLGMGWALARKIWWYFIPFYLGIILVIVGLGYLFWGWLYDNWQEVKRRIP